MGVPIWAGRPVWTDDALLAVGLAIFGVVGTLGAVDNQPTSRPPGLLGWGLLLVASAAVAFRRRHPMAVLVALGLANDEIAGRLVVSPATVRTHVSRAMTKLHARDRAQLVVFAYQSGLVGQTRSRPD